MLITVVNQSAEQALLQKVEKDGGSWGALFLRTSRRARALDEDAVVLTPRSLLGGRKATLYFFYDGDLAITWQGAQKSMIEGLCAQLYKELDLSPDEADCYYDARAQGEELRRLCRQKLRMLPPEPETQLALSPKTPAPARSCPSPARSS